MILPFQIKKKETFVRFIIYFVLVTLAVSVGEIILGTLVEKVCHFYWWDYTVILFTLPGTPPFRQASALL